GGLPTFVRDGGNCEWVPAGCAVRGPGSPRIRPCVDPTPGEPLQSFAVPPGVHGSRTGGGVTVNPTALLSTARRPERAARVRERCRAVRERYGPQGSRRCCA